MKHIPQSLFGIAICALAGGCVGIASRPAPGADRVQLIRNPADVAACTAVGNVAWRHDNAYTDVRNLTVGLGGNAIFVTSERNGFVLTGVAYRCPQ
jgi:hypothetical protein